MFGKSEHLLLDYIVLGNGVKMPQLGYGVYQVTKEECERCVLDALKAGYRLIDTAQSYFNEEEVGSAIKKSGIPREEIFLTTKVWIEHYGYEACKASIDESLRKLQTDYIDLMLLHQPFADYYGAWRALEEYYEAGKIRAIGISNFYPDRMVDIATFARIKPMVNQIEIHPHHQQRDIIVIPKSTHYERMTENFDVFDFVLSDEDMAQIATLDKKESSFFSHYDPNMVEWFGKMVEERRKQQDCSKEEKNW